jgi:O-antigen biosynthesis protein
MARARFLFVLLERGGKEKESLLDAVMDFLLPRKYLIAMDQGWSQWDWKFARDHGPKLRSKQRYGKSWRQQSGFCACAARCVYLESPRVAWPFTRPLPRFPHPLGMKQLALATAFVGLLHGCAILYQKFRLGRVLYHVIESLAHKLEFVQVEKSS